VKRRRKKMRMMMRSSRVVHQKRARQIAHCTHQIAQLKQK
jgi:hypothetical protein